jgi:hypothetical protein
MTSLVDITEGWTSALDFQLLLNGAAFDATGMTLASVVRDREGKLVTVSTAWGTQATSLARLSPVVTDFVAAQGPYSLRFRVTDGAGKIAYFPQGDASRIGVFVA